MRGLGSAKAPRGALTNQATMIEILYFARLRERLGCSRERVDLPPQVASVADLMAHLRGRGGIWAESLGEGETLLMAVNQAMARPETPIQDGDEVALFPPVTGG